MRRYFVPLITSGNLVRIWWLDRRTQRWYFYDPDPLFRPFNSLRTVPLNEVVIIKVNRVQQFRNEMVHPGWNYILIR